MERQLLSYAYDNLFEKVSCFSFRVQFHEIIAFPAYSFIIFFDWSVSSFANFSKINQETINTNLPNKIIDFTLAKFQSVSTCFLDFENVLVFILNIYAFPMASGVHLCHAINIFRNQNDSSKTTAANFRCIVIITLRWLQFLPNYLSRVKFLRVSHTLPRSIFSRIYTWLKK